MHCNQACRLTEHLLVNCLSLPNEVVIRLWFPSWIAAGVFDFESGKPAHGRHHVCRSAPASVNCASLARKDLNGVGIGSEGGKICGVLNQAWYIGTHGQHAVWDCDHQFDHRLRVFSPHHLLGRFDGFHRDLEARIKATQVGLELSFSGRNEPLQDVASVATTRTTIADASRGIALCALPPLISAISRDRSLTAAWRTHPSTRIAFARPW